MRQRTANVVLGGGAFIGFVGVLRAVFDYLGYVQTALWLRDLTEAGNVAGLSINWVAISFYILVFCCAGLAAVNWNLVRGAFRQWRAKRKREWNMTASDAINYVAQGSRFSESLDHDKRHSEAMDTFIAYAQRGLIVVAGRPKDGAIIERIPRHIWKKKAKLSYRMAGDTYDRRVAEGAELISRADKSNLFRGLMVDRNEIGRVWPPKPNRF
jgi:hypothetical protein